MSGTAAARRRVQPHAWQSSSASTCAAQRMAEQQRLRVCSASEAGVSLQHAGHHAMLCADGGAESGSMRIHPRPMR
eukprot:64781-Chlamydomonas_euryale.AAC.2